MRKVPQSPAALVPAGLLAPPAGRFAGRSDTDEVRRLDTAAAPSTTSRTVLRDRSSPGTRGLRGTCARRTGGSSRRSGGPSPGRHETGRTCAHHVAATILGTAAILTLTGCGAEPAGSRVDGPPRAPAATGAGSAGSPCPSRLPRHDGEPAGSPAADPGPRADRTPLPLPTGGLTEDGVEITGLSGWTPGGGHGCRSDGFLADFTVTNHGGTAKTYTVTLGFLSASKGAVDNVETTVLAVRPGQSVRRTVRTGELPPGTPGVTSVSIVKVRSVPLAEAPSESGPCPASGVRVHADRGDAAMGLRVVGLHLENCGKAPYRLNGRPKLQIVDASHEPVTGVSIVPGDRIATGTGADGTPRDIILEPGERAYAGLVWRNTTEAGDGYVPVNAPYLRVWARPGARPVMTTPELDLGTTGRLGVGPWKKEG
ncbi:DUF4232 domain-containing protein [Streptomyces sp. MUSC 125]|uniref:DUF4232 domain-containing protein n=1 Tax=Streptomyces sp. MUSC 125 TaxID=1428624 RepID=UPI000AE7FF55|nr:DUF4232 domain-containing protein [Streptomyces sp. MUSC 125]